MERESGDRERVEREREWREREYHVRHIPSMFDRTVTDRCVHPLKISKAR